MLISGGSSAGEKQRLARCLPCQPFKHVIYAKSDAALLFFFGSLCLMLLDEFCLYVRRNKFVTCELC